jgi:predicted transcriptional regulator
MYSKSCYESIIHYIADNAHRFILIVLSNADGRRRGWCDIIADILTVCKEQGKKTTTIMYECEISYPRMKQYLTLLTSSGLLKFDETLREYSTTIKGTECIDAYGNFRGFINAKSLGMLTGR